MFSEQRKKKKGMTPFCEVRGEVNGGAPMDTKYEMLEWPYLCTAFLPKQIHNRSPMQGCTLS
jgi:hypothetical protein